MNTPRYSQDFVLELAQQAYQHGQASFDLDFRRAALLVIDMQAEFVEPEAGPAWVPAATAIIPTVAAVLQAARQAQRPVIHTAFGPTHFNLDRPASGRCMPNRSPAYPSPEMPAEPCFAAALRPLAHEVVLLKPSYGAFYDTPLDTMLRNLGIESVVITGTLTNLCCGTTARQAYERGYQVVFASDATATNSPALHEAELQTLRYGFARVCSAAEIILAFQAVRED